MSTAESHLYRDNAESIGRTPLVRLNRITDGAKGTVLAKIEGRNPAYSMKCRLGAALVWDAEKVSLSKQRAFLSSTREHNKNPSPTWLDHAAVVGLSRTSKTSLVATVTFMLTGILTVVLVGRLGGMR